MRARLTTFLILAALASGLVLYLAMGKFVYLAFDRIERTEASANLSAAVTAIRTEMRSLNTWVRDYAPWDETYAFAAGEDPGYVERNFAADTIENLGFDLILVADNSGRRLWSFQPASVKVEDLDYAELPIFPANNESWESTFGVTGIHLLTPGDAYLFAAHPILDTDANGPVRGTLLFARRLDNASFEQMIKSSVADFGIHVIEGGDDSAELIQDIEAGNGVSLSTDDVGRVFASTVLVDMDNQPRIIVRAASHRDATAQGAHAILSVLSVMAMFWMGVLLVWWVASRRIADVRSS